MESKTVVYVSPSKALTIWVNIKNKEQEVQFINNGRVGFYVSTSAQEQHAIECHRNFGKSFKRVADGEQIPGGTPSNVVVGPRNAMNQVQEQPLDPKIEKIIKDSNEAAKRPADGGGDE